MPLVGNCAKCGATFFPKTRAAKFCKETECGRRRRRDKRKEKFQQLAEALKGYQSC